MFVLLFGFAVLLSACQAESASATRPMATATPRQEGQSLRFRSSVRAIHQAQNGDYWFGSDKEGVARFDGQRFTYFNNQNGLPHNQVRSIQEDAEGNIWFGTANGVSRWNGERTEEVHANAAMLAHQWTLSSSDLWFNAGQDYGAYRWDGQELLFLPLLSDSKAHEMPGFPMTGYTQRQDGRVSIASYGAVLHFDGSSLEVLDNAALGYGEEKGYLHVRSILEDSKGRLWVGNNGIGVLLEEKGVFTHFSEDRGLLHTLSARSGSPSLPNTLEHVFSMAEDHDGNIWFGDRDTGAWRFDGKAMQHYATAEGLSDRFVCAIHCDHRGSVWIGLGDGAVMRFNGSGFDRMF